jgi:hypothetical protein
MHTDFIIKEMRLRNSWKSTTNPTRIVLERQASQRGEKPASEGRAYGAPTRAPQTANRQVKAELMARQLVHPKQQTNRFETMERTTVVAFLMAPFYSELLACLHCATLPYSVVEGYAVSTLYPKRGVMKTYSTTY